MEVEILTMGTYNANGIIYPKETIEWAIEKFNNSQRPMFCEADPVFASDYTLPMEDVSHKVTDLKIEGDKVFATIKVLSTPKGEILKELLSLKDHDYVFRAFGTGHLGCDGIIEDYTMLGVSIMHKDDAA